MYLCAKNVNNQSRCIYCCVSHTGARAHRNTNINNNIRCGRQRCCELRKCFGSRRFVEFAARVFYARILCVRIGARGSQSMILSRSCKKCVRFRMRVRAFYLYFLLADFVFVASCVSEFCIVVVHPICMECGRISQILVENSVKCSDLCALHHFIHLVWG